MRWPFSMVRWCMAGWATLWVACISLLGLIIYHGIRAVLDIPWLALVIAGAVVVALAAWAGRHITERWSRTVRALADGISSLRDRDFSISVTRATQDEMAELV